MGAPDSFSARPSAKLFWTMVATVAFCCSACGIPFGIYHEVREGETLYRIARTYNVPVQKVVEINRIKNPTNLRVGQLVFVPGARDQRYVSTTTPAPQKPAKPGASTSRSSRSTKAKIQQKSPNWNPEPKPASAPPFRWPVLGKINSGFGTLDSRTHDGVDISAPIGQDIKAAADGTVLYAGDGLRGYGNLVILKHKNGYSTIYAHNKENLVRKGSYVAAGEIIGTVGMTGRTSGPHLHFEIRRGKKPVNPLQYLPKQP